MRGVVGRESGAVGVMFWQEEFSQVQQCAFQCPGSASSAVCPVQRVQVHCVLVVLIVITAVTAIT